MQYIIILFSFVFGMVYGLGPVLLVSGIAFAVLALWIAWTVISEWLEDVLD